MSKLFYDHLIHVEEVISVLNTRDLETEERDELVTLIDELFHQRIVNSILAFLPQPHHEDFVSRVQADPTQTEILIFLKETAGQDIEDKIREESQKLAIDLINEIEKASWS